MSHMHCSRLKSSQLLPQQEPVLRGVISLFTNINYVTAFDRAARKLLASQMGCRIFLHFGYEKKGVIL